MKKQIWAICLFFITTSVNAAEINFLDNPVWSTVLEKAKKENKMIFLDGYATWCGPCKTMDSVTYKNEAVADYYNANFINVKIDMEKGEGPMLVERYFVTAYPNLMFLNTDGVILHKGIGYHEAADFVTLGKAAQNPETQYFTLKKKAMELSNAQFAEFTRAAVAFEDEDFEHISSDYLAKQADILGNIELINLIMNDLPSLADEKTLAYIVANKAKIVNTGKYTPEEVEQRLVSLTLSYGIYANASEDQDSIDFDRVKALLDKYVPEKAFFVFHYFRTQFLLEEKKPAEAIKEFEVILDDTPAKISFEQLCNAMMSFGPVLAQEGKLTTAITKFDAIQIPASEAKYTYMKDFVKGIIYIKTKEFDKFKVIANSLIADPTVPESVKTDLRSALDQIAKH